MDHIKQKLKKSFWNFIKFIGWTFGIMTLISCGLTYLALQPGNLEKYNEYVRMLAEKYPETPPKVIDEAGQAANME